MNENLPNSFQTFFTVTLKMEQHRHNTRRNSLNVPPVKTKTYGSDSQSHSVRSETGTSYKPIYQLTN